MLSGWKRWSKDDGQNFDEGDLYYLGTQDEGWARTSWQWLEIDPDLPAFEDINEDDDNYKDECWFYFKTNGKAYVDDTAKYNNKTYSFDKWGRMLDLWVYPEDDASKSDSGLTNSAEGIFFGTKGGILYRGERRTCWKRLGCCVSEERL